MKEFTAFGSHGSITYDETGLVIRRNCESSDWNYDDIARVDVNEYIAYNGGLDDTDILLIGYWTLDGKYEPADMTHRALIAKELAEKEKREP